jgi:ubiquitin
MERRIEHVRDLKSGTEVVAVEFFQKTEGLVFQRRRQALEHLMEGKADLVCSVCNQPVHIAGTKDQEFFFKHYKEKGNCPIKTKGELSQSDLDRLRYAGVKESDRHLQLKDEIEAALRADSQRCSNVRKEQVRRSAVDPTSWRKPDVSCEFLGRKLVFEVQLSTTYLNVILEREAHYRADQTFVIWLFASFDPNGLRFVEKDILYANHGHAFVFDEVARAESVKEGRLIIRCYRFVNPAVGVSGGWVASLVELADLQYDTSDFRAFLARPAHHQLAVEFEAYWMTRSHLTAIERIKRDGQFGDRFAELGMEFDMFDLSRVLDALYSLKAGVLVGYNFNSYETGLLQIAHVFCNNHTDFLRFFLFALDHYGKTEVVKCRDNKGRLKQRVDAFRKNMKDPKYSFPKKYGAVLRLLFPELPEKAFR